MADTEHGRMTDEGIAKLRARIGQGFPGRRPWRTEVSRDAIYHLARALPDLRGSLLRPGRAARRAPQRHLDPYRADQDPREKEVRRDRARPVDTRGHRAPPGRVPPADAHDRAVLGRREGGRPARPA